MGYARCKHGEKGLSETRKLAQNYPSNFRERFSNVPLWGKETESTVVRMADGLATRVDRLKAIGNGQVPQVAAFAWSLLSERLANRRYG